MPIPSSAELKALYAIRDNLKSGLSSLCCKIDALSTGLSGGVDHELFIACDATTGAQVIVSYGYDSTGALTISYTNIDGTPASSNVVACSNGTDYEFTQFQWFCDKVNQESISRTDLYVDGVFTSHIWQDINGNVIPTPIVGNLEVGQCTPPIPPPTPNTPEICGTYANNLGSLCSGHNFSITKPSCCEVEVATSIGTFILNKSISFYSSSDFVDPLTVDTITILSGTCKLSDIYVIVNKLK